MVGLFKKLSKKKKKERKGFGSASEDESCTEDEGTDKFSYLNHRNFAKQESQQSSNGIRSVTPSDSSRQSDSETCNGTNSANRSSYASSIGTFEEGSRVSFDVGNIDKIVDSLDDDDDETVSITSADEGSLFDEDILSQFQDGQISLQQFLQSPHLSRSEERIRDEEMDSMFSDARSMESSNFYSDSSSDSDRTEKRDQELDRIAGEMFSDYAENFANKDERFAIQKSSNNSCQLGLQRSNNRDSYYSIGEETITNSINDLTTYSEKVFPNGNGKSKASSQARTILPTPNEIADCFSSITDASNIVPSNSCASSTVQPDSLLSNSTESTNTENAAEPIVKSSSASPCDPYTPRRTVVSLPDNLPVSPLSFSMSPINAPENPENEEILDADGGSSRPESSKSLLDRIHGRMKTPVDNMPKRKDTPIDLCLGDTSVEQVDELDDVKRFDSRPASAQSQLSQREVAIIDNTVMSLDGNYVINPGSNSKSATLDRGKSQRIEEKVDPWLSYLPKWNATASTDTSPARCVSTVSDQGTRSREELSHFAMIEEIKRPASAVPPKLSLSPSNLSEQDRYIRFSSLDVDFFIPPPPMEEDVVSNVQEVNVEATPFNLEWDYEIADSPTLTPSSSVIYLGNKEGKSQDEPDPIGESLLGLLPIQTDQFQQSVCAALGEIITEIVSSRQKFLKLSKILEFQDSQIKEQRKLIYTQAKELAELKHAYSMGKPLNSPRSPQVARRNEFKSYPATGRRSKELIDLENTLDKLLFQCHSLQRNSRTGAELQVFQPVDRSEATSRAESYNSDDGSSIIEVKTLLRKKIPESPANHVQIVPAKGVVFKSCKETKEDVNAIQK